MSIEKRSNKLVDLRNKKTLPPRAEKITVPIKKRQLSSKNAIAVSQRKKKKQPLRERRASKRRVIVYAALALSVCGIVGLGLLSFQPSVTIAAVRVEGVHTIIPSQIETAVFRSLHQKENTFFSRSTIATAHMGGIEAFLLNEFPQIKTVQVRRYGMTTLRVDVVERTQFALWCSESEICFSVDENGMLYESAERQNSDSIIISGGLHAADGALREKILGDRFSELTALIAAFTAYDLGAERVHISSDMSDATFTFPDTPDVIVLLRDVPTTVARIVATALRDSSMKGKLQGLEYVDARYGARVYYKKRNEEPRESAEGNTVR